MVINLLSISLSLHIKHERYATIHKVRYLITRNKRLQSKVTDISIILITLDFTDKFNTIIIFHIDDFDLPKGHGAY
jgi:hypothetical protein